MNSKKNEHLRRRIERYKNEHPDAKIERPRYSVNTTLFSEQPTLIIIDEVAEFTTEQFNYVLSKLHRSEQP